MKTLKVGGVLLRSLIDFVGSFWNATLNQLGWFLIVLYG
jgi:hypothetical protein